MIEALREIGEYSLNQEGKRLDDLVDIIVEDPASSPKYKYVLVILFNRTDQKFDFRGINQEEYSKGKIGKYLYKKGAAKGSDFTPTARITELGKTFENKILLWFKNIKKNKDLILAEDEKKFIQALYECIEINRNEIFSELKRKLSLIDKGEACILTLKINNGTEKYIGELPIFRKILAQDYAVDLYHSVAFNVDALSKNQICSVCRKKSDEVYGFVSTYTFYNVDKPGFISGGFNRQDSWKNYPVCLNCALTLESGKQYVENHLDFKFYGLNYYLIPKLLQKGDSQEIFSIIEDFKNNIDDSDLKIKKEYGNLLSESEKEILEILAQQKNCINNNFLFYEKSNSAFRILLYIEDIVPSRLRELFEAKRDVENKTIFKKFTEDGKSMSFSFRNIWHFFPRSRELDMSKYFLEITNNIFVNKKIDYSFLMWGITNKIQKEFAKDNSTKLSTLLGFQLLNYLSNLNLIENLDRGSGMDEKDIDKLLGTRALSVEEKANNVFNEFKTFFTNPAKKAIFLEGALAQLLLNVQHQERGSEPFRNKLKGLKLDEPLVKRLLPEMQNKLEEYDKNYYRDLESVISKYMIQAGEGWKLSKDEIGFYFVLGMNLHYLFKSNTGGKKNE